MGRGQRCRIRRDRERTIFDRVAPLLPGRPRLTFKDELTCLRDLQNDLPEYWETWRRFAARLQTLEARSDVQELLAEAQALCRSDVALGQIEAVYLECTRIQEDPPDGLTAQDDRQSGHPR